MEGKTGKTDISLFEFPEFVDSIQLFGQYSCTFQSSDGILYPLGQPCDSLCTRLNTGDICLFSTYRLLSAGTRFITRSKWDHVGVIVVMNQIPMLVEVTYPCGVEVAPASARLHLYR
jgi:hypothetical protein